MRSHEFSARFKKDIDKDFKNAEFERKLAEFMVGFAQCYPHLIEITDQDTDYEIWRLKFDIKDDPS